MPRSKQFVIGLSLFLTAFLSPAYAQTGLTIIPGPGKSAAAVQADDIYCKGRVSRYPKTEDRVYFYTNCMRIKGNDVRWANGQTIVTNVAAPQIAANQVASGNRDQGESVAEEIENRVDAEAAARRKAASLNAVPNGDSRANPQNAASQGLPTLPSGSPSSLPESQLSGAPHQVSPIPGPGKSISEFDADDTFCGGHASRKSVDQAIAEYTSCMRSRGNSVVPAEKVVATPGPGKAGSTFDSDNIACRRMASLDSFVINTVSRMIYARCMQTRGNVVPSPFSADEVAAQAAALYDKAEEAQKKCGLICSNGPYYAAFELGDKRAATAICSHRHLKPTESLDSCVDEMLGRKPSAEEIAARKARTKVAATPKQPSGLYLTFTNACRNSVAYKDQQHYRQFNTHLRDLDESYYECLENMNYGGMSTEEISSLRAERAEKKREKEQQQAAKKKAIEEREKEDDEKDKILYAKEAKRFRASFSERKDVGDQVCSEGLAVMSVEKVYKDKIQVRSHTSGGGGTVTTYDANGFAHDNHISGGAGADQLDWIGYREVGKCEYITAEMIRISDKPITRATKKMLDAVGGIFQDLGNVMRGDSGK